MNSTGRTRGGWLFATGTARVATVIACILGLAVVALPSAHAETVGIGGPGSLPQASVINLSYVGSAGSRQVFGMQYCSYFAGSQSTLDVARLYVGRSPSYAGTQTLTMHVRLDLWNGRAWTPLLWHPAPQSVQVPAGRQAAFETRSFKNLHGTYRTVEVFTWYVNGRVIAQTYDSVNGDAIVALGTSGYIGRSSGDGQGWCVYA